MKIYGKQVLIGTKKLCVEYTSKIVGEFEDCHVGYHDYKGEDVETDIVFFMDKKGYLVDVRDIDGSGFLELTFYGACPRFRTQPRHAGDEYIDDIKPYFFSKSNQETSFDLNTLIKIIKNEKSYTQKEDSILTN